MITVVEPNKKENIDFNAMIEIIYYIKDEFRLEKPCFIYMGGSLVYKDIRNQTKDLDISVSPQDYENIKNILMRQGISINEYIKKTGGNKGFKIYYKNYEIEIFKNMIGVEKQYMYHIHVGGKGYHAKYDNSIYFQKISEVLKMKIKLNREKDRKDIELIQEYIKTQLL